jgi:hypothetical protein
MWLRPSYVELSVPVVGNGPSAWPTIEVVSRDQLRARQSAPLRDALVRNERFIRLAKTGGDDEPRARGDIYPQDFWRELVTQWIGAFERPLENEQALHDFYRDYGPVTAWGVRAGYESVEAARLAVEWLRKLCLVDDAIEGRDRDALRVWSRGLHNIRGTAYFFRAAIPGIRGQERLDIAIPDAQEQRGSLKSLALQDYADPLVRFGQALIVAGAGRLAEMLAADVTTMGRQWIFEPKGALNGAFLQWYARKHSRTGTCLGCREPVPPGREIWCSDRCRERVYKQRQRGRRRVPREDAHPAAL